MTSHVYGWKTYCCYNSKITQIDLQSQLNSYQIPASLVEEIYKLILKFMLKSKGQRTTKTILEKKNKAGGFTFPNLKFTTEQ